MQKLPAQLMSINRVVERAQLPLLLVLPSTGVFVHLTYHKSSYRAACKLLPL
jgi:hypothetical protein